jgi:uncharacterized lipoprotein NlpE involved in copper resistance
MIHLKKKACLIIMMVLFLFSLTGCWNQEEINPIPEFKLDNAIAIDEAFSITATLVDSFSESYYRREELLVMVSEEASAFNTQFGAGSMRVEKVETGQDLVNVVINFANQRAYENYFEAVIFIGTIEEALNNGFKLDVAFNDTSNGETVTLDSFASTRDIKIFITNEHTVKAPLTVETFGKILYVSDGVDKWLGNNSVRIADAVGEFTYVVFK